jgi:hypothetical protein
MQAVQTAVERQKEWVLGEWILCSSTVVKLSRNRHQIEIADWCCSIRGDGAGAEVPALDLYSQDPPQFRASRVVWSAARNLSPATPR